MPSGRTHDVITIALAVPVFAGVYTYTRSVETAAIVTAAFIFGGLMFGPDLDTVSRQYSRWSVFRVMWYPYRSFFKHRSRFSHGLIFGALLRVIYFLGVTTLIVFLAAFIWAAISGSSGLETSTLTTAWRSIGNYTRIHLGESFLLFIFLGLWIGAASHTFTDMAGSFIKTGRAEKFL